MDNFKKTQERLFKMEKLATIGMVARGVAHDMNNKLAAIITTVQMELQYRKDPDPELQESLELIHEATKECRDLLQKLFKYSSRVSKVESDEIVDFEEIVDCVVSLLKYRLDEWGIKVECDFKVSTPLRIYSDELIHLFMHLILNAVDAIRKKGRAGGIIRIQIEENQTGFVMKIKDNGEGVSESVIPSLFEPSGSTSENRAGLDLSIVQRVVRKYNGDIKVKSTIDTGSEFTVHLPKAPC